MGPSEAADPGVLPARAARIRRLALALVRDEHEAEDLAQDAWVAALTKRPRQGEPWSRWIAAVMRNFARARWRGERRREARERDVAREEAGPPAADAAEQLEAHELVVRAVRSLDEPYRSAIWMRYFEGLAPREIAERAGAPPRTVETRLHRGLQRLRERLDERHRGDRGAWLALLVPLARPREAALAGAALMSTQMKVAAVAVIAAGLIWTARVRMAAEPAVEPAAAPPTTAVAAQRTSDIAPPERGEVEVALAAPPAAAEAEATPAAVPSATPILGVVVDAQGDALAGLRVVARDASSKEEIAGAETHSDARGAFELAWPEGAHFELDVPHAAWVVVLRPEPSTRPGADHVVVLAPRRAVAGVAVDEAGAPLQGAAIELALPGDLRATIDRVLDRCVDESWDVSSGDDGAFAFDPAPDLDGLRLLAKLQRFEPASVALDRGDQLGLTVVLKRPGPDARRLVGRVVGERGERMGGAYVSLAADSSLEHASFQAVTTSADGSFEIALDAGVAGARVLRALKEGFSPAEISCATPRATDPGAWPDPLVLVLRGSALAIDGVVVDADGRVVERAEIVNLDATRFGELEREWSGTRLSIAEDVEDVLAGRSSAFGGAATTDADGRFEVRGLLPRAYRLRVFSRASMEIAVTEPIQAGSRGVVVRMPRERRHERIAGVVVGKSGAPIAEAQVWLVRTGPPPARSSVRGDHSEMGGETLATGANGRFEFRGVSAAVSAVCARIDCETAEVRVALDGAVDAANLRIVVTRNCHFKVDLTGSAIRATSLEVRDAAGETLPISVHRGTLTIGGHGFALGGGDLTEAYSVPEDAVELVLRADSGEDLRVPLRLVPGELTIVRP
jgi:RNA polymerase sigma-70 factor (ECF subfamily)